MPKKYKLLFLLSVVRAGSMLAMEQDSDLEEVVLSNFDKQESRVDNSRPKGLLNSIRVRHIEHEVANGRIITKLSERIPLVNEQTKFQIISTDESYEEIVSQQLGKAVKVDLFTTPLFGPPITMIKSLSDDSLYHNKLANVLPSLTFDGIWIEGDENHYCYVNIKPLEKLLQKQKGKLGNVQGAIGLIQTIKINNGQVGQNQTYCHVDITPLEKEKFGYKEVFECYDTEQDGYTVYYNNPLVVEAKSCQEEEFDLQMKHYKYLLNRYNAGFPTAQNQILEVSKRYQRKIAEQNEQSRYKTEQKIKSIEQQDKEYLDWAIESKNKYENDVSNYEKITAEFGEQTAEFNKQKIECKKLNDVHNQHIATYQDITTDFKQKSEETILAPIVQNGTLFVLGGLPAVITQGPIYVGYWLWKRNALNTEYAKQTDIYNKQNDEHNKQNDVFNRKADTYNKQTEAYNKLNEEHKMKTEEYNNEMAKRAAEYAARQAEKAKLTEQLTERPNSQNCVIS